jgi:hypothetical protein
MVIGGTALELGRLYVNVVLEINNGLAMQFCRFQFSKIQAQICARQTLSF